MQATVLAALRDLWACALCPTPHAPRPTPHGREHLSTCPALRRFLPATRHLSNISNC